MIRIFRAHRPAFTLIELLIVMGMIGMLASVVIVAVNPLEHLTASQDATRNADARELKNALYQYLIDHGTYPNASQIPEGAENAKAICREGITDEPTCVNLDALVPDYLSGIPFDEAEQNTDLTGYTVHLNVGQPTVTALYLSDTAATSTGVTLITEGLVGHWKLDETTAGGNDSIADASGGEHHGTPSGAGGANDKPQPSADTPTVSFANPRSLHFDGTDDGVSVGDDAALNPGAITISVWVKTPVAFGVTDAIVSKGSTVPTTIVDYDLRMQSGKLFLGFYNGSWHQVMADSASAANTWIHMAGTYDGSALKIYADGTLVKTTADTSSLPNSNGSLFIGRYSLGEGVFFGDGHIDDVRLYDRALSQEEIAQIAAGEG